MYVGESSNSAVTQGRQAYVRCARILEFLDRNLVHPPDVLFLDEVLRRI